MYFANQNKKRAAIFFFLLPSLFGVIVFALLPIVASLLYSFLEYDILKPLSQARWIGFENYRSLFSGKEMWLALWHTVQYILYYVPAVLLLALGQALLLNRSFKGSTIYRVIFYTPVITSWVAAAVIWKWLLSGKFSPINQALTGIGLYAPAWLVDSNWAMAGISLAAMWKDCGYFALLILAAMKSIDKSYYEAATIDGAGAGTQFFKITLPLISPTLFLLLVTIVIGSFQVFDSVQIIMAGLPNSATTVMMERIYNYGFKRYEMGNAAAWSWVLFLIILFFTQLQFWLQKKWVNYDG